MHAFVPVRGGLASKLEDVERRIIARLVADTAELLGTRLDEEPDQAPAGEDAVLDALDFDPSGDSATAAPTDAALARLLPPMSQDEDLAAELRGLTEDSLRAGKVDRLATVWRALSGPAEAVLVRDGTEGQWLAALTDVRLVLASRLGIEEEDDAERVYRRAQSRTGEEPAGDPSDRPAAESGEDPANDPASDPASEGRDDVDDAMATMYAALTWWQESLLHAMTRRGRGRGR